MPDSSTISAGTGRTSSSRSVPPPGSFSGSATYARWATSASSTSASLCPLASASSSTVGLRPSWWPSCSETTAIERLSSCSERGTRTAQPRSRNRCMISPSMVRAAYACSGTPREGS